MRKPTTIGSPGILARAALQGTALLIVACLQGSMAAQPWQEAAVRELCAKYSVPSGSPEIEDKGEPCLDGVARIIGRQLSARGLTSVPAEDLATLALLMARSTERPVSEVPGVAGPEKSREKIPPTPGPLRDSAARRNPSPGDSDSNSTREAVDGFSDLGKGQEGFAQGVEELAKMPVGERMAITGDITSGLLAATVSDASALTSTFGRARVNFVTRAVPATGDGHFGEGYFFVQMVAAGGPFDASAVGGPSAFSPINDVATDRSRFNEGTSRGNLYLAKAFYQQDLRFGDDQVVGRVGIISLSDFFDTNDFANNESRQFLNGGFVNNVAFKADISAPGFMGEYHRQVDRDWLDRLVLRTGYAISRTERAFTSPIWTGEIELQSTLGGYAGKYRFGGTVGNVADVGGLRGFHLSFDQWVSPRLGVYGRYGLSNSGVGSLALGPARESYGGGIQWRFVDRFDHVSAWGLGFTQTFGIETDGPMPSERALETYYRWQVTENFALTPDFQLVFGSGGSQTQGTHLVGGLRMNFGF